MNNKYKLCNLYKTNKDFRTAVLNVLGDEYSNLNVILDTIYFSFYQSYIYGTSDFLNEFLNNLAGIILNYQPQLLNYLVFTKKYQMLLEMLTKQTTSTQQETVNTNVGNQMLHLDTTSYNPTIATNDIQVPAIVPVSKGGFNTDVVIKQPSGVKTANYSTTSDSTNQLTDSNRVIDSADIDKLNRLAVQSKTILKPFMRKVAELFWILSDNYDFERKDYLNVW